MNAPRPPVNYPTLPVSERIEGIKRIMHVIKVNNIPVLDEKSRDKILAQLSDAAHTLELLMYGD